MFNFPIFYPFKELFQEGYRQLVKNQVVNLNEVTNAF